MDKLFNLKLKVRQVLAKLEVIGDSPADGLSIHEAEAVSRYLAAITQKAEDLQDYLASR